MDPHPSARPPATAPASGHADGALARTDIARRVLAKLIDGLVAGLLFVIVSGIVPGAFGGALFGALAAAAYWIVSDGLEWAFLRHRSLGKRLLGLQVVGVGRRMDLEASARRNWMFALGGFTNPAGWILSLVLALTVLIILIYEIYNLLNNPGGRRWGDHLAGTRVVVAS